MRAAKAMNSGLRGKGVRCAEALEKGGVEVIGDFDHFVGAQEMQVGADRGSGEEAAEDLFVDG